MILYDQKQKLNKHNYQKENDLKLNEKTTKITTPTTFFPPSLHPNRLDINNQSQQYLPIPINDSFHKPCDKKDDNKISKHRNIHHQQQHQHSNYENHRSKHDQQHSHDQKSRSRSPLNRHNAAILNTNHLIKEEIQINNSHSHSHHHHHQQLISPNSNNFKNLDLYDLKYRHDLLNLNQTQQQQQQKHNVKSSLIPNPLFNPHLISNNSLTDMQIYAKSKETNDKLQQHDRARTAAAAASVNNFQFLPSQIQNYINHTQNQNDLVNNARFNDALRYQSLLANETLNRQIDFERESLLRNSLNYQNSKFFESPSFTQHISPYHNLNFPSTHPYNQLNINNLINKQQPNILHAQPLIDHQNNNNNNNAIIMKKSISSSKLKQNSRNTSPVPTLNYDNMKKSNNNNNNNNEVIIIKDDSNEQNDNYSDKLKQKYNDDRMQISPKSMPMRPTSNASSICSTNIISSSSNIYPQNLT
jgi:hypothetical protein